MPVTRQRLLRLWVFAALRSGNPYVYGGSFAEDPRASTDCSGAVFSAAAILSGLDPHRRWGSTETLRLARLNNQPAPCGLVPAASKDAVPADAPLKVGVMHGEGGGAASHTACSFFLGGRRFDFESRGTPGVLLDSGARGWDDPIFTDFWFLPGPVLDDPSAWPLPPGVVYGPLEGTETQLSGRAGEPAAWTGALREFQRAAGGPETGVYDPATLRAAEEAQAATGQPVTGLVDEAVWRAARAAEHGPAPSDDGPPAVWADVSEWQGAALDDSCPHPVFCFRTNDGGHRDLKAIANARAAKAMLDAGRLRCVIA
ncbi:Peptidoglycan-binding domain 1 protein [Segniliparus rotundus DSM 44985]|uniref:Peptidoglycan-binding domain 1 protein n=1 Tax=Segniliparus rotundus (strain ATCC BAA-972 / CDC 1076 / CIP 108378 / DSM 44985 / JCM 13578) TaxID=640132 RepID=D6ZAU2_SEGRD|nr:peptidoglycan-binding domain-containing protein [Segniliparus rotundus]ADG98828.1 Peptidoglycan-binding domain 1 protein [Segniliparus rotundus DSM 44985]